VPSGGATVVLSAAQCATFTIAAAAAASGLRWRGIAAADSFTSALASLAAAALALAAAALTLAAAATALAATTVAATTIALAATTIALAAAARPMRHLGLRRVCRPAVLLRCAVPCNEHRPL